MSGDFSEKENLEGFLKAYEGLKDCVFHLFGDEALIKKRLKDISVFKRRRVYVHHFPLKLENNLSAMKALRLREKTSLHGALEYVRAGKADAILSGASTGPYLMLARKYFGMLEGIKRPAITGLLPSEKAPVVFLDIGANIEAEPIVLQQYAELGSVYHQVVSGEAASRVGLLNIGSEDLKGRPETIEGAKLLEQPHPLYRYEGFVEGLDIFKGDLDVIVTDGFAGNIALKSIEGTANFILKKLKVLFKQNPITMGAYAVLSPYLKSMLNTVTPKRYNGALLLGLQKLAVKSHGGADEEAFSHAVQNTIKLIQNQLLPRINRQVNGHDRS